MTFVPDIKTEGSEDEIPYLPIRSDRPCYDFWLKEEPKLLTFLHAGEG